MHKLLSSIFFIFSLHSFAATSLIRDELLSYLPKNLSTLSNEDNQILSIRFKKMISSKDNNSIFLNYFSQNDVTIGLKNNRFDYLLISPNQELKDKTKGLFEKVFSKLTQQEKLTISKSLKIPRHDAGRKILINLPTEGLSLEFVNNEAKTLSSMIIWRVGGK
jgi:hypothetical protein